MLHKQQPTLGIDPRLPLPLLRDAMGRLDHRRLQPHEQWPVRVEPDSEPDSAAPALSFPLPAGALRVPFVHKPKHAQEVAELAETGEALQVRHTC